jgi:hypothetical protein
VEKLSGYFPGRDPDVCRQLSSKWIHVLQWATAANKCNPGSLFSILGTTYGGNGQTTFALPDLRGAVPVGPGIPANVQLGPWRSKLMNTGLFKVLLVTDCYYFE